MEIRVLTYYAQVAKLRSISGAAKALNLTQPTLSRQMKELEEELGTPLFTRGSHGIALTPEGILLQKRADEILSLVERTSKEVSRPNPEVEGDVNIGAGESAGVKYLAQIAVKLQTRHPGIRFNFVSGDAMDLSSQLEKGLLDFALMLAPQNNGQYDSLDISHLDTWGVLVRNDSPLASLSSVKREDLKNEKLILSRQQTAEGSVATWLGSSLKSRNTVATYNLLYNAALLVEEGLGVALCIDSAAQLRGFGNLTFRPLEPNVEIGMKLLWKKDRMPSRAAAEFLDLMRKELQLTPQV